MATQTYKHEHLIADSEFQFDSCPDALGFDVIAELQAPVSCFCDSYMPTTDDLAFVWMEIGHTPETTQWLDIKPALTPELILAVVKTFQSKNLPTPGLITMKNYLILSKYRHSVIEFFDDLVAKKQVVEFFVGSIDPDCEMFPLAYQIAEGYKDIAIPHFHPFYCDKQYEYRAAGDIKPVESLKDALDKISKGDNYSEQDDAISAIMDYCDITLSMVDFEDDGHFKVEASLEWQ